MKLLRFDACHDDGERTGSVAEHSVPEPKPCLTFVADLLDETSAESSIWHREAMLLSPSDYALRVAERREAEVYVDPVPWLARAIRSWPCVRGRLRWTTRLEERVGCCFVRRSKARSAWSVTPDVPTRFETGTQWNTVGWQHGLQGYLDTLRLPIRGRDLGDDVPSWPQQFEHILVPPVCLRGLSGRRSAHEKTLVSNRPRNDRRLDGLVAPSLEGRTMFSWSGAPEHFHLQDSWFTRKSPPASRLRWGRWLAAESALPSARGGRTPAAAILRATWRHRCRPGCGICERDWGWGHGLTDAGRSFPVFLRGETMATALLRGRRLLPRRAGQRTHRSWPAYLCYLSVAVEGQKFDSR